MSGTASDVFDDVLKKILDPRTRSAAIIQLTEEMQTYHNSQFIYNNHTSISLIFNLFRARSERTPELARLIVLFVISGYRARHEDILAQFKFVADDEYSCKLLREYCILGLAVFRLFMDVGVEEKKRIKDFLQGMAIEFNRTTGYAAHIARMATLNYQEYLNSIKITEAQVPDPEQTHNEHLQSLVFAIEHFVSTDGLPEHEDNNKRMHDVLEFLRNEATNMEDDGFTLIEKNEEDQVEVNMDSDGFVHL